MKHLVVLVFTLLAACGKADDVPAMKIEAEGITQSYRARFEELWRRTEALAARGHGVRVQSVDALALNELFQSSMRRIKECNPPESTNCTGILADLARAPAEIAAIKDRLELRRYMDRKARELGALHTELQTAVDAIESWMDSAERQQVARHGSGRMPAPPPPTPEAPGSTPAPQ